MIEDDCINPKNYVTGMCFTCEYTDKCEHCQEEKKTTAFDKET